MGSSQPLIDGFKKLGHRVERVSQAEIYRLGSKILWLDYSKERRGVPGTFFHGTKKAIFERFYRKYPDDFFIVFVLGFPKSLETVVISAHRFQEMFKEKATDRHGDWKYGIHELDGKYVVKTWGIGDFDVTDAVHKYEFLGLTSQESELLRGSLSHVFVSSVSRPRVEPPPIGSSIDIDSHEAAQAVLLLLGRLSGFETYTPDRAKEWRGKSLGGLATVTRIPEFTYQHLIRVVGKIDIIWFQQGFPHSCFEVENSTIVRDGLHREFQIAQATNAKFFIVGPDEQRARYEREIETEPYRAIKGRYRFLSYKELIELYERARLYYETKQSLGV